MPFTPAEKAKIKMYLGYPNLRRVELLGYTILPSGGTETLFIIERNMDAVPPEGEGLIRDQLKVIDCIVQGRLTAYASQNVVRAGSVEFAGLRSMLASNIAYNQETDVLADLLHTPKATTSLLHQRIGGMGSVIEPC